MKEVFMIWINGKVYWKRSTYTEEILNKVFIQKRISEIKSLSCRLSKDHTTLNGEILNWNFQKV